MALIIHGLKTDGTPAVGPILNWTYHHHLNKSKGQSYWKRQGETYEMAVERVRLEQEMEQLAKEQRDAAQIQRKTWRSVRGYQLSKREVPPVRSSPGLPVVQQRHYWRKGVFLPYRLRTEV